MLSSILLGQYRKPDARIHPRAYPWCDFRAAGSNVSGISLGAATQLLGRAVQLAHESENVEMTTRLARVVDVVDPTEGTVRLKRGVGKAAEMDLELESTTTRRARRPGVPGASS